VKEKPVCTLNVRGGNFFRGGGGGNALSRGAGNAPVNTTQRTVAWRRKYTSDEVAQNSLY